MTNHRKSWRRIRFHLGKARNLLPLTTREDIETGSLDRFENWLGHNELELALDELEGLGELNTCSSQFWRELLRAARNMGLREHSSRYEAKLDQRP
ncbi:MAG: hypothetical protein ACR2HO_12895 [Rubrobacteraceae bacterium]|nr:hypothetical protein [Rubrobacter sp.]